MNIFGRVLFAALVAASALLGLAALLNMPAGM